MRNLTQKEVAFIDKVRFIDEEFSKADELCSLTHRIRFDVLTGAFFIHIWDDKFKDKLTLDVPKGFENPLAIADALEMAVAIYEAEKEGLV